MNDEKIFLNIRWEFPPNNMTNKMTHRRDRLAEFGPFTKLVIIYNLQFYNFERFFSYFSILEGMSDEEKTENVQEEPEDPVNEEEMNTEEVYDSISQVRVNNFYIFR